MNAPPSKGLQQEVWLIPHAGPLKGYRVGPFFSWEAARRFDVKMQSALWGGNVGPSMWGPTSSAFFLHFKETPITPAKAAVRVGRADLAAVLDRGVE